MSTDKVPASVTTPSHTDPYDPQSRHHASLVNPCAQNQLFQGSSPGYGTRIVAFSTDEILQDGHRVLDVRTEIAWAEKIVVEPRLKPDTSCSAASIGQ